MKTFLTRGTVLLLTLLLVPSMAFAEVLKSDNFALDQISFGTNTVLTSNQDGIPPAISSRGPQVTELTPTSATVSWETDKKSSSKVEYGKTIKYGLSSGNDQDSTAHSVKVAGLTPETAYHFRVASEDAFGTVGYSTDYTFSTPALTQFQEVSVSQVTYTTALVKVIAGGLKSIKLSYGVSSTPSENKQVSTLTGTTENNFPLKDLKPGTKYYLTIVGTDNNNVETSFNGLTFTTIPEPKINGFSGKAITPNDISVTVDTITPTTVTLVYKSSEDSKDQTAGDTVLSAHHELVLSKLFGNATYIITATITDGGGKRLTSDSITVSTPIDSTPPVPSDPGLTISKVGDKILVTARWDANKPVKGSITITSKVNPKDVIKVSAGSAFSISQLIQATGLAPKTPYVLEATSVDNAGNKTTKSVSFVTPSVNKSIIELILQNLSKIIDPISKLLGDL